MKVINTNGATKTAGYFYTGTTDPTDTNRLNYDGYFYSTKLFSEGVEELDIMVKILEKLLKEYEYYQYESAEGFYYTFGNEIKEEIEDVLKKVKC